MRYKKFQISGAIDLDEIETLWITDVGINDGSILQHDRVKQRDLEVNSRFNIIHEYLKVDKYLYQRVDAGKNVDENYGQATTYYYVLPESHPSFNIDVLYKAGQDNDMDVFDNIERGDMGRAIVRCQLPEFVKRNTYANS